MGFVKGCFGHFSTLFGFIQFVLDFAEFGHVNVSGFFSFLRLAFVGLDLDLEFVDQILETGQVLLVFLTRIDDFLKFAFKFLLVLLGISSSALLGVKFVFEFANTLVQFLDLFLTSLHCDLFGFVKSKLEILDGGFHVLLHALKMGRLILFLFKFFGHHGGITNSLLGLFFGVTLFSK